MITTNRQPIRADNWEIALVEWVRREVLAEPFVWGKTDCVTIAREGLRLSIGRDPFPKLKRYKSLRGAKSAWKAIRSPESFLASCGAQQVAPRYEQAGDLLLWDGEDGDGLPRVALVLPVEMVVTSMKDTGVVVAKLTEREGATFWRWMEEGA